MIGVDLILRLANLEREERIAAAQAAALFGEARQYSRPAGRRAARWLGVGLMRWGWRLASYGAGP